MKRKKEKSANFRKMSKSHLRRQKGNIKKVLYWLQTNIWHHRSKFSRPGDLVPHTWRPGDLATWHRRPNHKSWLKFVFCIKFYMYISFPFNNSNFRFWITKRATFPQRGSSYSWDNVLSPPLFSSTLVGSFAATWWLCATSLNTPQCDSS